MERMEKIAFIGLGIMGSPMAGRLLAAGYPALNRTWLFPRAQTVRARKKYASAKKSSGDGCKSTGNK